MNKILPAYLEAKLKYFFALLALAVFVGFFVILKFLNTEFLDWDNLQLVFCLCIILAIDSGILGVLAFRVCLKKHKLIRALIGAILGIAVSVAPLIALRFNDVCYDGHIPNVVLNYTYYPMSAVAFVFFVMAEVACFRRCRKAVIKATACILIGAFAVYMMTDYNFTNYIHKDGYKELKNQTASDIDFDGSSLSFTVSNNNGSLKCKLSNCGKAGWRLQSEYGGEISDQGAGELLAYYLDEDIKYERLAVTCIQNASSCTLTAPDGSHVNIEYKPFKASFYSQTGALSSEITTIGISESTTVVRGKLLKKEAMWGGGEHFDHVNQRGQHVVINAMDMWSTIEGNSYMPIPILISSRGSGLFMNRFERMTLDVDSYEVPNDIWQFAVPDAPCDLFIYATEAPADVLYGYSTITGFAPELDDWNYGIMICRYYPDFSTLEGMQAMESAMAAADMPWDGIIIEGFNYNDLDALQEVCDYMHGIGKKVMIYCASGKLYYLDYDSDKFTFVSRADNGSIDLPDASINNPVDHPETGTGQYVDITDEKTQEYIFGELWGHMVNDIGIDGAKIDFCEQFPDFIELNFADGETSGAHHWYPVVYNSLLRRTLSENANGTYTICRGGGIGAQRYSYIWMGDQMRTMEFSAAAIKGVLSSGISGVPFTTYDMAGYANGYLADEEDVFMRSVEYSAFTGCIQTHGSVKRAYDYPENVQNVYRAYTKIHEALRPYLVEQGKISSATGLPLVRHLALAYWQDENVWDIEDEFMLGSDILVAPVLEEGATARNIYLPAGEWVNLWTGEKVSGGRYLKNYSVPQEDIAVFVKANISSSTLANCLDEIQELYLTRK